MSKYSKITEMSNNISAEEKLSILRSEMILPIMAVRGYANLLKDNLSKKHINDLPEDFEEKLDRIIESSESLYEILETLTGKITKD